VGKGGKRGERVKEKGKGMGMMGESRVRNRRIKEIKREEGGGCDCEDYCEIERERGKEKVKEE
jgi:hypothetical protein